MRYIALVLGLAAVVKAGGGSSDWETTSAKGGGGYGAAGSTSKTTWAKIDTTISYSTQTSVETSKIIYTSWGISTTTTPVAVPTTIDHTSWGISTETTPVIVPTTIDHTSWGISTTTTPVAVPTTIDHTSWGTTTETSLRFSLSVSVSGFTETQSQTLTQTQILPGTTVTLTTSISGSLTTIVSALPPVTVTQIEATTATNDIFSTITTTEVSTAYVTYTAFTSKCDFCKVDLYGIGLAFPTTYVAATVYATTIGYYTNILPDGSYVTETSVTYAPTSCGSAPQPTTWLFSGVELTSPTQYMYFTKLSHEYLFPSSVAGGCGLSTLPLVLPTTEIAALILPTDVIPPTPTVAPAQLVSYIDSFPTIIAQLNGTLARDCDAPTATVDPTNALSTETGTTTTTVDGITTRNHPASPQALAQSPTASTSTPTSNSPATAGTNTSPVNNTPASSGTASVATTPVGGTTSVATTPVGGTTSVATTPVGGTTPSSVVSPASGSTVTVVGASGSSTVVVGPVASSGSGSTATVVGASGTSTVVIGPVIGTPTPGSSGSSQAPSGSASAISTLYSTLLIPESVVEVSNGVTTAVPATGIPPILKTGLGGSGSSSITSVSGSSSSGAGFTTPAVSTTRSAARANSPAHLLTASLCAFVTILFCV